MIGTVRTAVVTVSYDSRAVMSAFLDSVPRAAAEPVAVYVADNKPGSADREQLEALLASHGAHYRPMADNLGYGHAVNTVVASLPPEIELVLVTNPDVVLGERSLDTLVAALDAPGMDDVASIGPRITELDGTTYPSARSVPSLRNGIGHALFGTVWPTNPWSRAYRHQSSAQVVRRDAGWLSGACLLVRRAAFDALEGFDTGYFMYFEDVDLGYRFGRAGWRNVYEPAAVVVHTGAHSTTAESARMLEAHHASARRFLHRKYRGPLLAPVRWAVSAGLALRARIATRSHPHD
ncbi:glycosyltransferase family 2 protein [Herbiconiux moechotypicola]|uniref:Glycosyltransferase family 2 protein n=1 Tax=Herbiconiux moechotypicola TaxID=637393 RepID=A0ABN3DVR3_9MICO|nr:glycosyltransferase family 2 protein [Herbiconiux moechotypicola]MCS5731003.1 glycosyltransferase family 2 protein [Herbiconiux moechotypicola]